MAAQAFDISWDYAHYSLISPVEMLLLGKSVRDGWEAGQSAFGTRTLRATAAGIDASIDRVNNQAGYATRNLAVMSTLANQAGRL